MANALAALGNALGKMYLLGWASKLQALDLRD